MTATSEILRGELERLFELEEMKRLCADLLGYDPEAFGGAGGKGAFARALVEQCASEDALQALADAIILSARDKSTGDRVSKVFSGDSGVDLPIGTELGGYRVSKKVADEGGLGVVYLGEKKNDSGQSERVAIKVIMPAYARDRGAVRRYLTACRALGNIEIAGVAPIVAVGQLADGRPWVATKFVEGQTLGARVSRIGAMHFNEARPVVRGVLESLEALHKQGIVHGDVKAENVFMVRPTLADGTRGDPTGVLVDGGTDRLMHRMNGVSPATTGLFAFIGTPKALAPELARGKAPSVQSDVYAAGVLLYEVLSGRPPFKGETAIDVVAQHVTVDPEPPSAHAPRGWIPKELDELVLKALAKDPTKRWKSARDMIEAFESVGRGKADKKADKQPLDEKAFDAAAAALREVPEDEERALALERVIEPAGAWKQAIPVFEEAAQKTEDVEAKKSHLFRVARIQEMELEDRAAAEATYRKILEIDSGDEIAQIGIEELKRAAGDAEELVEILLEKAERQEDPGERASVLREIAQLYEEKLDDAGNAFVAWTQALADDPGDSRTAREVERLAEKNTERWNEAMATLSESAQEPQSTSDAVKLYTLMGRWYAEHLSRPDFALECYNQALASDPAFEPAYEGTVELYRKTQSWKELVTVLLQRADAAPNPARARELRADAAEVVMQKLNDRDRAAGMFQEIVEADPANPKAASALEVILADRGSFHELVKLLERRSHGERGDQRVQTLVRIGEIYEDRLGEEEKAQVSYEAALAHDPQNLQALKGLERLYAKLEKYKELLGVLETQLEQAATPRQKIALLERIGGIREEEFVQHESAVEAFERLVEIEPGHDAANTALARLYRHLQRFDDLANTLDRHAKASSDDDRKRDLLLSAVKVLMVDVGAPERAMELCERVLALAPEDATALDHMARLKAQTGDAAAAIQATERLADNERDPAKKADLWLRAGRLLEDKGDKDGAIERYKRALDADAKNVDAASALRVIYAGRGDAHGAAELLQREIDVTEGPISKGKLYAEMGQLQRDRLEDPKKAGDSFRKALELDPTCTPAARGIADMAFEEKNWAEAAKYYEPLLARTGEMPPSEARDLCLRCGDAFRSLSDFEKAQRSYLNAKAFAPDDREVLERVADVTFDSGEPDEAAELYRDLSRRFADQLSGGEKGRILYRLGESARRANSAIEAIKALDQAAELMPEAPEPLGSLRSLYEAQGKWELVVRTLRRRMEHADDDERFQLLVDVGDVLLNKMGDRSKASKSYVAALEIRPDERNLLTKLMGVYSESKDWSRLVEVILRIADLVEEPKQLAKYYNTAAAISHRELGRLDEAGDYYEQALDNGPTLQTAFEGLVDCLGQRQDWGALAQAYRQQLTRLGDDADASKRALLYDALGDVLHQRLSRTSDAVEALEAAHELDADNRQRLELLSQLYAAEPKRYFSKAVRVHHDLLHKSPYRIESYQALRALYTDMKRPDESWCVCQALTVLNMAEPDEESFFKKHRSRSAAAAQEFFDEELWFNHITHGDQDPLLTGIFAVITPAVVKTRARTLEQLDVHPNAIVRDPENDAASMAQTLHYVSGVSQVPLPPLYYRKSDPGGLSFLYTAPPSIGLGQGALAGAPTQALAFVAGRHLSYFRGGHYLRHLVPTGSGLRAWLLAAIKSVQPSFPVPADLSGPTEEHRASLKEHLQGREQDELQSLVHKLLAASPSLDMKKWVAAVDLTADRVGFVLSNSLEIASAVIKASPDDSAGLPQKERLKELYLYSVCDEYLQLRHKLGIAIGD